MIVIHCYIIMGKNLQPKIPGERAMVKKETKMMLTLCSGLVWVFLKKSFTLYMEISPEVIKSPSIDHECR